jgi:hypothetical protein
VAQALHRLGQNQNALTFANQALALAPEEQKPAINELIDSLEQQG